MRPLGKEDSKRLFLSRIFGSVEACPKVFEDLSADILKKCGGQMGVCTVFSGLHV